MRNVRQMGQLALNLYKPQGVAEGAKKGWKRKCIKHHFTDYHFQFKHHKIQSKSMENFLCRHKSVKSFPFLVKFAQGE